MHLINQVNVELTEERLEYNTGKAYQRFHWIGDGKNLNNIFIGNGKNQMMFSLLQSHWIGDSKN